MIISRGWMRRRTWAASLAFLGACAPSLSSQVASVGSLSRVGPLPPIREGDVDPSTASAALKELQRPLDADAAVRIALINNRELRAQLRELGISTSQVLTAGLVANPTIEFELLPERDSRYELRAEYDLASLIVAPMRHGAAMADLEAARLRAAGAVVQLGYDVRERFYALQAAVQRQELAQRSLDALAAARAAAQALLEAGNIRQLDAASQIAAHERARVTVARMELEVAERREEVQRVLGLHGEQTDWRIARELPRAPESVEVGPDLEQQAFEANLDLRAARKQLDGLAKQSGVIRTRAWLPELAADVHALRVRGEPDAADAWRWGAGVAVQLPLFDRRQGELRGIEAQFDAALERYQGLAVDLRSAARDARNRWVSAQARAHQFETVIVPAQRAVLEQTLLQYNAMQIGVFQLLEARRDVLDVELEYVDTLRDYWTAAAEMQALRQGRVVRSELPARRASPASSSAIEEGH
jgi:outer membrane protein, heavy metal efflux system